MQYFVLLWLFSRYASASPLFNPIRIDLPVFGIDTIDGNLMESLRESKIMDPRDTTTSGTKKINNLTELSHEKVDVSSPLPPGEDRRDRTVVTNVLAHKLQIASDVLKSRAGLNLIPHADGYLIKPMSKLESAVLEREGFGSQKLTVKENLEHLVFDAIKPRPLLDTIEEHEKYGNHGEKFGGVGKAIVDGAARVSSAVNAMLEGSGAVFRSISRFATEKLNNLGGILIGL